MFHHDPRHTGTYPLSKRGPLFRIEVSPDSVTLIPGWSQQFTASGFDSSGNPVFFQPEWNSTGGMIDGDGLYVAGSDTGNYAVSATDMATQIEGRAYVHIILCSFKGDVNGDCSINVIDVVSLTSCCILEMCPYTEDMAERGDCNDPPGNCSGDSFVNVLDAIKIVNLILGLDTCP